MTRAAAAVMRASHRATRVAAAPAAALMILLREIRDILVYMDDFLIYAKTKEEHDRWVKEVLRRLQENRLTASAKK